MAKIKPKLAIRSSGWVEPVFTAGQIQLLLEIVNNDEFIVAMDKLAFKYKSTRYYETQAPNAAEIEAVLNDIKNRSEDLKNILAAIDNSTKMLLVGSSLRNGLSQTFVNDIKNGLEKLGNISTIAVSDMDKTTFRKTKGSQSSLAAEIRELLGKYGITTTSYDNGPWCTCISITLDACGESVSEPRNLIRKLLG